MNKIIKDIACILTAVLVINILSCFLTFRLDFTSNKRYSLSKLSKNIICSNTKPVSIDFYVTEQLPHSIKKLAEEFQHLLKEYKSLSDVDFTINTIHPNNPKEELKATKAGIVPIYQEVREKDLEKIQRIFMGAVLNIGDKKTVIPRITFNTPIEYEITRSFKQSLETKKPSIGFVRGHRESTFNQISQLISELSHLTTIQQIDLESKKDLKDYNVLCIIDPKDTFTAYEIKQLENYLEQGGRLFVLLNHAIGQLETTNNGFINRTGIESMLEKKGLKIKYDFIVDNNCGTIETNQQYGLINFQNNLHFPYIPIITNFSKHTITYGLKSMLLPFASSIEEVKTDTKYTFTPLAKSSSISGVQKAPVFFDLQKEWSPKDYNHPHNIVAALLDNNSNSSSIIAITDADFVSDDILIKVHTDNINFAINSIEWLADNSGLIQLRNKFTTVSLLEPINDNSKTILKYLSFLLPIVLIILIAILYRKKQGIRRKKRYNI